MKRFTVLMSVLLILSFCTGLGPEKTETSGRSSDENVENDPKELTITAGVTDITEWSAKLSAFANPTAEMSPLEMGILYSKEEDPSLENGKKLISKELDSAHKYVILAQNLSSSTTYYYKSFVYYGGVYQFGKVKTFTTKTITASVSSVDATDITPLRATLRGQLTVQSNEKLTSSVWFLYSNTLSSLEELKKEGTKKTIALSSEGSFLLSLSNLSLNTKYYYVACATVADKEFYGSVKIFQTSDVTSGTLIDMGLSVKWASCNLGANSPEEYGDYYAWGETTTKSDYSWSTYKWGTNSYLTKYNIYSSYGTVDDILELQRGEKPGETVDDAARAKFGGKWRMPSPDDIAELKANSETKWITFNGQKGLLFVSKKNGNSIFLPAAGVMIDTSLKYAGLEGCYHTSYCDIDMPTRAYELYFISGSIYIGLYDKQGSGPRCRGGSVRPVSEY